MSKVKLIYVFILTLFSISSAYSQNNTCYGGSGHFSVGTTFLDYSSVNTYLRSKRLPAFASTSLNIGGGGLGIFNSFILGGEGGAVTASSVANINGQATVSAGFGMFNIGYAFPLKSRFLVYPLIGLGWGGSSFNVKYAGGLEEKYEATKFFISSELNCELFSFADENGKGGFKTGICIGYLFNPQTDPWKEASFGYTSVANTFMNGPYFKIKIGGGGIGYKKKE
jgi:opacity protein-like surface antigen